MVLWPEAARAMLPLHRCAVVGCRESRVIDTDSSGEQFREVARRWCERHCAAYAAECALAGPAPVLQLGSA